MSIQPGWHTTIFPPYFVAGAILSGTAMVYNLVVPVRKMFNLEGFIRKEHLDSLLKFTLLTSSLVFYAYIEFFVAWYSGAFYEGDFQEQSSWSLLFLLLGDGIL